MAKSIAEWFESTIAVRRRSRLTVFGLVRSVEYLGPRASAATWLTVWLLLNVICASVWDAWEPHGAIRGLSQEPYALWIDLVMQPVAVYYFASVRERVPTLLRSLAQSGVLALTETTPTPEQKPESPTPTNPSAQEHQSTIPTDSTAPPQGTPESPASPTLGTYLDQVHRARRIMTPFAELFFIAWTVSMFVVFALLRPSDQNTWMYQLPRVVVFFRVFVASYAIAALTFMLTDLVILRRLLRAAKRGHLLRPLLFHHDGTGGFGRLVSFYTSGIAGLTYSVVGISLGVVRSRAGSLRDPFIICALSLVLLTFFILLLDPLWIARDEVASSRRRFMDTLSLLVPGDHETTTGLPTVQADLESQQKLLAIMKPWPISLKIASSVIIPVLTAAATANADTIVKWLIRRVLP